MKQNELQELVDGIVIILKGQVIRIVLYGSAARGDNTLESDVDIAIFINKNITEQQDDMLSEIIVDMNLKYDKVFSVVDINQEKYLRYKNVIPFYRNVEKEGIVLWKAA